MTSLRRFTAMMVVVVACGSPTATVSLSATTTPAATTPSSIPPTTLPQGTEAPETSINSVDEPAVQPCADVIEASADEAEGGSWRITATVRSGDTGWDKYADEWTVHGGGELLGTRVLDHPHETEQPFTRSLDGVIIPPEILEVEVTARDSVNGYCGEAYLVTLDR